MTLDCKENILWTQHSSYWLFSMEEGLIFTCLEKLSKIQMPTNLLNYPFNPNALAYLFEKRLPFEYTLNISRKGLPKTEMSLKWNCDTGISVGFVACLMIILTMLVIDRQHVQPLESIILQRKDGSIVALFIFAYRWFGYTVHWTVTDCLMTDGISPLWREIACRLP